jgi:hypothetical protein
MRAAGCVLLASFAGCAPNGDPDGRAGTDGPAATPTSRPSTTVPPPYGTIEASCALQADNALRVDCDVALDPPGPIDVSFAPIAGGDARAMSWDDVATAHHVTLWRMYADTDYAYTFTARAGGATTSGAFTTGTVPLEEQVAVGITGGAPTATDDVMFQMGCGVPFAVAIDPMGQEVWYQPLTADLAGPHSVQGISFTPEQELVAVVDNERERKFGLDGALLMDAGPGVGGLDKVVHHDAFGRDGLVWALNADSYQVNGGSYVLDGFYVLDASGAVVGEWELAPLVSPAGGGGFPGYWGAEFPGAIDYSHANGLYVNENHDVFVSLFELDTVLEIRGDPASPDFGELVWSFAGDAASPFASDFSIVDPGDLTSDLTFSHQHNPTFRPDGTFSLFDNETVGPSRALEFDLDDTAGTATITASLPLPATCPVEGANFLLDNGDDLVTCAMSRQLLELDHASGAVVRTISPSCPGMVGPFGGSILARGIPVRL